MRSAKHFFQPMAIGAPTPLREVPFRPSRMIHFFDPSNEKMAAKIPDIAKKVDVLLGNLEDAIAADNKLAARQGLIKIAKNTDFGDRLRVSVDTSPEESASEHPAATGAPRISAIRLAVRGFIGFLIWLGPAHAALWTRACGR